MTTRTNNHMGGRAAWGILALLLQSAACSPAVTAAPADNPVKVFILAGQSNMEGKAQNSLLEFQATAPQTRDLFAHLRKDNEWIVRDEVFIKYLDRKGGLTIGYGSPGRTGVELEFGTVIGDHFAEPVLLIKTAWGGHSLYKPFRPPSAGLPSAELLQAELGQAQDKIRKQNEKNQAKQAPLPTMADIKAGYGSSYRNMMQEVKDTFDNYGTLFPALKGKRLELAGFVWFQGFNDMFGDQAPGEYAANMEHFIKDVRKDLKVPKLPFVIGALGQNGSKPASGGMLAIQTAQLAMNEIPEFKGNVKAIRTDILADQAAEALIDGWQNHVEEWQKVGSDRAYHYLGSAIWFTRIGHAMAETMMDLLPPGTAAASPLFAFDNGLTDVAGLETKAALLAELGYAGIAWRPGHTAEMLAALDQHGLKMFATYVTLNANPEQCPIPDNVVSEIKALKGRDTIVWLNVSGKSTDDVVLAAIRKLTDLAAETGLKVVIYPHAGCYTDTLATALRLVEAAGRPNLGVTFNLCHFLKQHDPAELEQTLRAAAPKLLAVSINGADDGDTRAMGWDRLIRPLGEGTYDVAKVMRLLDQLGYNGPVSLQCYRVMEPAKQHLGKSIAAWKQMRSSK